MFAREINGPFTGLVKELDKAVAAGKSSDLKGFVVFLTDNRDKLEPQVAELAKKEKIENIPLTIVEGVAGPEKFKIDKSAEVTVMLYSRQEAKANFSFEKGKLDEKATKEILAALPKITGK
ncbi:MAG: hypothetical protein HY721_21905 [Planctomycetes bacterium]|nr:hypothetical protein [Planctomycetota bacterium]